MTYTFMAAQGGRVGKSICEPDQFATALAILAKAKERGVEDQSLRRTPLVADDFSENAPIRGRPPRTIFPTDGKGLI